MTDNGAPYVSPRHRLQTLEPNGRGQMPVLVKVIVGTFGWAIYRSTRDGGKSIFLRKK